MNLARAAKCYYTVPPPTSAFWNCGLIQTTTSTAKQNWHRAMALRVQNGDIKSSIVVVLLPFRVVVFHAEMNFDGFLPGYFLEEKGKNYVCKTCILNASPPQVSKTIHTL